jgi:hypothetical protein
MDEQFLLGLPGLANLEVRRGVGLEQAFLAITAEDDAANGSAQAGETI